MAVNKRTEARHNTRTHDGIGMHSKDTLSRRPRHARRTVGGSVDLCRHFRDLHLEALLHGFEHFGVGLGGNETDGHALGAEATGAVHL